jgi:putative DNA primase/helicase
LHQEFFEFEATFTPWLRTNHKPIITGDEDGIWRRLVLVPFTRKFSDDEQDPFLEDKLVAEKDGILMWMLAGATQYLKDGLKLSPRIKAEVNRYRSESDLLGEFLADVTTNDASKKVCQAALFHRYRYWCQDSGVRPSSKKSFTQRLAERGYVEGKSGVNRYYLGLDMRPTMFSTDVDRVDRIDTDLDLSEIFESHEEKTRNQETSRPSCPPSAVEVANA